MPLLRRAAKSQREVGGPVSIRDLKVSDSDAVGGFIEHWSKQRRSMMSGLERSAFLQVAWTLGHQTHGYKPSSSSIVDNADSDHSPWWRVNAVENRLLPVVEGRLSRLLARQPVWVSPPATSDEEDARVSAVGTRVLRHYWRNVLSMSETLWAAHWWAEVTGTCFLVATWDPEAGPAMDFTAESFNNRFDPGSSGEDAFAELFGAEATGGKAAVPIGDVVVEVRNLFETFVDPAARRIEDADWVLFQRFRTLDYLEDRYGTSKTKDLNPTSTVEDAPFYERLQSLSGQSGSKSGATSEDLILTKELWVKSSRKRPGGVHAVMAQGEVLRVQKNPYQHQELPVAVIHGVRVPMSIWGSSKVEQLMETQDRLNDIRSTKTEYMRMHVYPKILEPNTGEVDQDSFTTEFGERITYTPPFEPKYLNPPTMPSYLEHLEADALQAIQDLSDLHEVSTAQAPAGLKSGRAILSLQAQDEARLGPTIKLRNLAVSRLGRHVLSMLHQFVTEERLIQMTGDDLLADVGLFKSIQGFIGSDLVGPNQGRPGIDYFRVGVEVESELPLSAEGQRVVIQDLVQSRILDPKTDRDLILRMVGLSSTDPLFEETRSHVAQAIHENRAMAEGDRIDPQKWNNHAAHVRTHVRFMNSAEYRGLPKESQTLFENHLTRHHGLGMIELLRPQLTAQMAQQVGPAVLQQEMDAIQAEGPPPQEGDEQFVETPPPETSLGLET